MFQVELIITLCFNTQSQKLDFIFFYVLHTQMKNYIKLNWFI